MKCEASLSVAWFVVLALGSGVGKFIAISVKWSGVAVVAVARSSKARFVAHRR